MRSVSNRENIETFCEMNQSSTSFCLMPCIFLNLMIQRDWQYQSKKIRWPNYDNFRNYKFFERKINKSSSKSSNFYVTFLYFILHLFFIFFAFFINVFDWIELDIDQGRAIFNITWLSYWLISFQIHLKLELNVKRKIWIEREIFL